MMRNLQKDKAFYEAKNDPLLDTDQDYLIGKAYYSLKPLSMLFNNPAKIVILSSWGGIAGYLKVDITPIDKNIVPVRSGSGSCKSGCGN